ncbi:MAG: preprotein translocase subunit SecE [bacterium]|nr:preprotein translocase subunit SecE [bacterium]
MNLREKIVNYYEETILELKKVSWPTKAEIKGSTIVVIITSIVLAVFTFGVDSALSWVTRTMLGS